MNKKEIEEKKQILKDNSKNIINIEEYVCHIKTVFDNIKETFSCTNKEAFSVIEDIILLDCDIYMRKADKAKIDWSKENIERIKEILLDKFFYNHVEWSVKLEITKIFPYIVTIDSCLQTPESRVITDMISSISSAMSNISFLLEKHLGA